MTSESEHSLELFASATAVSARWDAARRLMAARKMQSASNDPRFREAFLAVGEACSQEQGLNRLLAVDLVIRISDLVKREYTGLAGKILSDALKEQIEGLWTIADTKLLPPEAKASEIRENIALSLTYAAGDWVLPYLAEALAREDRSQRVRLELCRQMGVREPDIAQILTLLIRQRWNDILNKTTTATDRPGRLRDIASALLTTIRENRSKVNVGTNVGPLLANLGRAIIEISPNSAIPPKLADAAVAMVVLLDEILATEFALAADEETYSVLGLLFGWWRPLPYPDALTEALIGVSRKLRSVITLRARMGQRSDRLVTRLAQALGIGHEVGNTLVQIAEANTGLTSDIDDWLRGRERHETAASSVIRTALSATSTTDFAAAFAPAHLAAHELSASLQSGENASSNIRRLLSAIASVSAHLQLEVRGKTGDVVEFNPNTHVTVDGATPNEPHVLIVRPMIVRHRADGSVDVVAKAIVRLSN